MRRLVAVRLTVCIGPPGDLLPVIAAFGLASAIDYLLVPAKRGFSNLLGCVAYAVCYWGGMAAPTGLKRLQLR